VSEGPDLFDPDNFVTKSALSGKLGTIVEADVRKHAYEKGGPEATVIRVVVVSDELEKPRVNLISASSLEPSDSWGGPATVAGDFYSGVAGKGTNWYDFQVANKSAGFPLVEFRAKGLKALIGAQYLWAAKEKKIRGEVKAYDIPAEFRGFVDVATLNYKAPDSAADPTAAPSAQVAAAAAPQAAFDATQVIASTLEALEAESSKEIPRAQLSIKVGSRLSAAAVSNQDRAKALGWLLKDENLSQIPGATFDKKVLKLTAAAAEPAAQEAA